MAIIMADPVNTAACAVYVLSLPQKEQHLTRK